MYQQRIDEYFILEEYAKKFEVVNLAEKHGLNFSASHILRKATSAEMADGCAAQH